MSSPTKRHRDETHASRQPCDATYPSTPVDLALQLRSVGSRVRKNVTEGYNTQSAPSSPIKSAPRAAIFTSSNDILRDVFGSPQSIPFCPSPKKRAREEDSDHESEDNMAMESEAERGDGIESDGETPRRPLMQTQSLPAVFGLSRGPLSDQNIGSAPQQGPEADWSLDGSRITSQPPAFEAMML
ncbi:hypothetical protein B0H12DRAFT_1085077 [Mycena haematopus]|nr:hypothetical protein B0H12DRAFT_1085077 [Mycena haematopus]